MKVAYYLNLSTGEITENQRVAVAWYSGGDCVEVVAENGWRVQWVH